MKMPKPKAGAFSRSLVDLIETRLRALRLSVHAAEKRYGFPPESLRSVLRGSAPSVDRFKEICDALEINFTLDAKSDAKSDIMSDAKSVAMSDATFGEAFGKKTEASLRGSGDFGTKTEASLRGSGDFSAKTEASLREDFGVSSRGMRRVGKRGSRARPVGVSRLGDVRVAEGSVVSSLHRVGESQDCPIVGIVRAGSEIESWNDQFPGGESVVVPGELFGDGVVQRWCGVVVRGESMSPVFDDGDILFFDMRYGGEVSGLMGRACVVETAAGGAMVKRLERGRKEGMYNLESYNRHHGVVADVVLRTARPVMWVKKG